MSRNLASMESKGGYAMAVNGPAETLLKHCSVSLVFSASHWSLLKIKYSSSPLDRNVFSIWTSVVDNASSTYFTQYLLFSNFLVSSISLHLGFRNQHDSRV